MALKHTKYGTVTHKSGKKGQLSVNVSKKAQENGEQLSSLFFLLFLL